MLLNRAGGGGGGEGCFFASISLHVQPSRTQHLPVECECSEVPGDPQEGGAALVEAVTTERQRLRLLAVGGRRGEGLQTGVVVGAVVALGAAEAFGGVGAVLPAVVGLAADEVPCCDDLVEDLTTHGTAAAEARHRCHDLVARVDGALRLSAVEELPAGASSGR